MFAYLKEISKFDDSVPIDNGDGAPITPEQQEQVAQVREAVKDMLDPLHSDRFLTRYLAAMNFNVPKAINMVGNHLKWRKKMQAERPIDELLSTVPEVAKTYAPPPHFMGEDLEGFPISWDFPGNIDSNGVCKSCSVSDVARYHGFVFMEQVYDKLRMQTIKHGRLIDKFIVVQDMSNWGITHMQKSLLNMVMEATKIRNANYPQILKTMIIINPPAIIGMCWKLIKPFLRERTRKKIHIIRGDPRPTLLKLMHISQIPQRYGGEAPNPPAAPSPVPESFYLTSNLPADLEELHVARGRRLEKEMFARKGELLSWIVHTPSANDVAVGLEWRPGTAEDVSANGEAHEIKHGGRHSPALKHGGVEVIVPIEKKKTKTLPEFASHVCEKDGVYTLIIDNSYSLLTGKTVRFSLKAEEAPVDSTAASDVESEDEADRVSSPTATTAFTPKSSSSSNVGSNKSSSSTHTVPSRLSVPSSQSAQKKRIHVSHVRSGSNTDGESEEDVVGHLALV